jgi:hypothetical protein
MMAALTVTAASVVPASNALFLTMIAQVAITAGQSVYRDASNSGKANLADADASAAAATVIGIAVSNAAAGQPVVVQYAGDLNPGATLTKGAFYCAGSTAGSINPTSDITTNWYPNLLGLATTTSNLKIVLASSTVVM